MAIALKGTELVPSGIAALPGCPSPHHHLRVAQMLRATAPPSPAPSQHTHKRKFRLCSGFGGDRLKAKHPARAAFRPASVLPAIALHLADCLSVRLCRY